MDFFIALSVIGLILLFLVKIWNVTHGGQLYDPAMIYVGFSVALILWLIMFFSYGSTFSDQRNSVIQDGNDTITIVQTGNQYVGLTPFLNLSNVMMLGIVFMTILETIMIANSSIIQPAAGRRSEKYR